MHSEQDGTDGHLAPGPGAGLSAAEHRALGAIEAELLAQDPQLARLLAHGGEPVGTGTDGPAPPTRTRRLLVVALLLLAAGVALVLVGVGLQSTALIVVGASVMALFLGPALGGALSPSRRRDGRGPDRT